MYPKISINGYYLKLLKDDASEKRKIMSMKGSPGRVDYELYFSKKPDSL